MFWSETSSTLSLSSAALSSETTEFGVAGLLGEPLNECVLNHIICQIAPAHHR